MEIDGLDDASVVERACTDSQLFSVLFDRHAEAVHRYAARRVGPADADDVLMTTFTAAFERRCRFLAPDHRSARPWLFGIAANVIKRHYRTSKRNSDLATRLSAERESPRVPTDVVEELHLLAGALDHLPNDDRETLLLVSLGELSYEETSLALGIPIGTVRSRVSRARGRLRDLVTAGETGGES